jgi:3-deoxy-D-manno-octulosonic-acid transferase
VHAFNLFKDGVQHHYLPVDLPFTIGRFLKVLSPKLVLVTEVEIWPNMLTKCRQRKIPVCLINARLSSQSLPTYMRYRAFMRPALRHFTFVCAQSQSSYDNFLSLGVYKPQLRLTQNMKFDLTADAADTQKAQELRHRFFDDKAQILVAASTHDGEEKFMVEVYKTLRKEFEHLCMMVVPRHPHRFDDVYLILKAAGLSVQRASAAVNDKDQTADVVLIDKMGWLKACYELCSCAFIGGSIAPKGGHNALECALYAKPMVMGPSTFNNPSITQYLQTQGALFVGESVSQHAEVLKTWLSEPALANEAGMKGKEVLERNSGAVEATLQVLEPVLPHEHAQA